MCDHFDAVAHPPTNSNKARIYKEECMYCFNTWINPNWIDVCLACYQGFCPEHFVHHMASHSSHVCSIRASCHPLHSREEEKVDNEEEPIKKEARVEEQVIAFDYSYSPYCHKCQLSLSVDILQDIVRTVSEGVEASKIAVSGWTEGERKECQHVQDLKQSYDVSYEINSCSQCTLKDNLWMCLECGLTGCGRKQFDGSGGNGHASEHYHLTKHSLSVKLGTLKNNDPDVYCYACDELVHDKNIDCHVKLFSIDHFSVRSEKGIAELQWEQNRQFDFSMHSNDGESMLLAEGIKGLSNLGNSCYMSSVMQCLIRVLPMEQHEIALCLKEPKDCKDCQLAKLINALLNQNLKIKPWMFKAIVTRGNAEFASGKQQDASEYLQFFLSSFKSFNQPLKFRLQQLIKCPHCGFQKAASQLSCDLLQAELSSVSPVDSRVTTNDILRNFFSTEVVQIECPNCLNKEMSKHYGLVSGPKECLVLVIGRSVMKNWTPTKLETPVALSDEIDLTDYKEAEIPFIPCANGMEQITAMGFPKESAELALKESDNDTEKALNLLLSGKLSSGTIPMKNVNPEDVEVLMGFGFEESLVKRALKKSNGSREGACDLLLTNPEVLLVMSDSEESVDSIERGNKYSLSAFISHKGPSLNCGHYIAHVRVNDKWVLFNDDRVVYDPQPDTSYAYIAFYTLLKLN